MPVSGTPLIQHGPTKKMSISFSVAAVVKAPSFLIASVIVLVDSPHAMSLA